LIIENVQGREPKVRHVAAILGSFLDPGAGFDLEPGDPAVPGFEDKVDLGFRLLIFAALSPSSQPASPESMTCAFG
jgi:hypothetical protein